jgi:hypothetical protein
LITSSRQTHRKDIPSWRESQLQFVVCNL